jgi:hypothetical protein
MDQTEVEMEEEKGLTGPAGEKHYTVAALAR